MNTGHMGSGSGGTRLGNMGSFGGPKLGSGNMNWGIGNMGSYGGPMSPKGDFAWGLLWIIVPAVLAAYLNLFGGVFQNPAAALGFSYGAGSFLGLMLVGFGFLPSIMSALWNALVAGIVFMLSGSFALAVSLASLYIWWSF